MINRRSLFVGVLSLIGLPFVRLPLMAKKVKKPKMIDISHLAPRYEIVLYDENGVEIPCLKKKMLLEPTFGSPIYFDCSGLEKEHTVVAYAIFLDGIKIYEDKTCQPIRIYSPITGLSISFSRV